MKFVATLALTFAIAVPTAAAPRRLQPDPAERTPGPVRYLVVATALQLVVCQSGEQAPCYNTVLVDFVRDTQPEARDLARQIAIEGCWQVDQSGETLGRYVPAHLVQSVQVSEVGL